MSVAATEKYEGQNETIRYKRSKNVFESQRGLAKRLFENRRSYGLDHRSLASIYAVIRRHDAVEKQKDETPGGFC